MRTRNTNLYYYNRCYNQLSDIMPHYDETGKNIGGRPQLDLTETQIRYAMENSWSNRGAAKFLSISINTYLKYASLYRDKETGLTLQELHKKKKKPKPEKQQSHDRRRYDTGYKEKLEDILAGHYPEYQPRPLRKRLFASGLIPLECASCGWNECRVTDGNYPLYIAFHDGNWKNKQLHNLYLLCFNCYFLQIGSLGPRFQGISYGSRSKPRGDGRPKGWGGKKWKEEREKGNL